ncbi:MAG: hypothetical protein D6743_16285, partial [Calditrichaeota bacterium]
MTKRVGVACLVLLLTASAAVSLMAQSPPLSPRNANYTMDVKLDPAKRMVYGKEILEWRNITQQTTDELQFHLYYNAWRNDKSSFLRSVRYGVRRWADYRDNEWAYCDV